MMRPRFLPFTLTTFAAMLATEPARPAQDQPTSSAQVTFVSGGVGADSAERMVALSKDFNLKLLFAARDGHYLAEVAVAISDARGAKVLEAVSEGPFFLARLGPGKYQVKVVYEGISLSRATTVPVTGRRELVFRWEEQAD